MLNELLERSAHEYVPSVFLAFVHAALQERDDGIRCLEQAYWTRDAWMTTILVEPAFDALRPHPRFGALVNHVLGTSEVG